MGGMYVAVGVGDTKSYSQAGGAKLDVQWATPFDTRNSSIQSFMGNDPSGKPPIVTFVVLVVIVCETVVDALEIPFK